MSRGCRSPPSTRTISLTLLGGAFRTRVSEEASDLCPPQVCPLADAQEATRSDYVPDPQVVVFPQGEDPAPVRKSLHEYEHEAAATLAAKQRLFGHGIYAIGPNPELVGHLAPSTAPGSGLRATIDQPERLATVDTRSLFVPSNVTGRLTGAGARAGLPVAVALNGRIAATGWTAQLKDDPGVILSFMVPPRLLHDGRNEARVYLIDGTRLVPL